MVRYKRKIEVVDLVSDDENEDQPLTKISKPVVANYVIVDTQPSTTAKSSSERKCSICRKPGHTKRTCGITYVFPNSAKPIPQPTFCEPTRNAPPPRPSINAYQHVTPAVPKCEYPNLPSFITSLISIPQEAINRGPLGILVHFSSIEGDWSKDSSGIEIFTARQLAGEILVDEPALRCNCGLESKRWVTKKAGPNHGRPFFSCPRPMYEQCRFFKWEDQIPKRDPKSKIEGLTVELSTPPKVDEKLTVLLKEAWKTYSKPLLEIEQLNARIEMFRNLILQSTDTSQKLSLEFSRLQATTELAKQKEAVVEIERKRVEDIKLAKKRTEQLLEEQRKRKEAKLLEESLPKLEPVKYELPKQEAFSGKDSDSMDDDSMDEYGSMDEHDFMDEYDFPDFDDEPPFWKPPPPSFVKKDVPKSSKPEPKREFGTFRCTICNRRWFSAFAYKGYKQRCNRCDYWCEPVQLDPLKRPDDPSDERKPHDEDGCERCKELGHSCKYRGGY